MNAHAKLTDDWVPLPPAIQKALGWVEGQRLKLEVVGGVLVVEADPDATVIPASGNRKAVVRK